VISTTLASPNVFGNIRPVGATNLGPTLGIHVTVPSTAFIPVGTEFNIVQTQTGTLQSGTNGSVLAITVQDPTNPLYTFSAVPPAGTIAGLVAIQVTGIPLLVAPPTPITAPIVPALLTTPLTPDVTAVLAAVNALSDPAAVVNAVTQLAPSTPDLVAPLVTFQESRQFQNLWMSRLDTVLCNQVSQPAEENLSCQGNDRRDGWWLKGFGYFGSQDARQGIAGYDSRIGGGMLAYDAPLGPNTRAGLGIGYARSTIDGRTFSTSTDSNSYQATAYVGHEVGPWFAYGDVSFGWNDYSGTRNISFPGISRTASADYSGQDYTAYGNTGYHFSAQEFTLTPFASLQYTHVNLDGYSESGAGDINLKVSSQSYDFLESGLGVKAARDFSYRDKVYVPEIHVKWLHELNNPTLQENAAFLVAGSPSFTTAGLKTADDTYNIGAGLSLLSCACSARTWSLEAAYDYEWRTDGFHAHQAMMRLTSRF
jgi:outer membrane autotransporter protein